MSANRPDLFRLDPTLDPRTLADRFAHAGRLQITDFLASDSANALHAHLDSSEDWRHIINSADKVFEASTSDFRAISGDQRAVIDAAMYAAAASGFQFQYDIIRVADAQSERVASGSLLDAFALFMNSEPVLALLQRISGRTDVRFADAQATRYLPGDFLTRHDDAVAGKDRVLAYVMNLSRGWPAEWGGLLLFNDDKGNVVETMLPRFNTLSLFAVPQPHSVSYIAPYASAPRLSVTGWLRTKSP